MRKEAEETGRVVGGEEGGVDRDVDVEVEVSVGRAAAGGLFDTGGTFAFDTVGTAGLECFAGFAEIAVAKERINKQSRVFIARRFKVIFVPLKFY